MGSAVRLFTILGFVVWTLLSLGAYGMVSLFGSVFTRNADAIAGGNPEPTEWLARLFGLVQGAPGVRMRPHRRHCGSAARCITR